MTTPLNQNNKLNLRLSYKYYKKNHEQDLVNIDTYLNVTQLFIKFMVQKALDGDTIDLPERMGKLFVIGKKMKIETDDEGNLVGLAPDWHTTKKMWEKCPDCKERKQIAYHFNEHTNGVRYRWFWSKKTMNVDNKNLYSFTPTRYNKRTLSKLVSSGQEYLVKH